MIRIGRDNSIAVINFAGLLRGRGPMRAGRGRHRLRPHRAGLRRVQRRGPSSDVPQTRHRPARVQVPVLLFGGRVLLLRHDALLQRLPRRLSARHQPDDRRTTAVPRR